MAIAKESPCVWREKIKNEKEKKTLYAKSPKLQGRW